MRLDKAKPGQSMSLWQLASLPLCCQYIAEGTLNSTRSCCSCTSMPLLRCALACHAADMRMHVCLQLIANTFLPKLLSTFSQSYLQLSLRTRWAAITVLHCTLFTPRGRSTAPGAAAAADQPPQPCCAHAANMRTYNSSQKLSGHTC